MKERGTGLPAAKCQMPEGLIGKVSAVTPFRQRDGFLVSIFQVYTTSLIEGCTISKLFAVLFRMA